MARHRADENLPYFCTITILEWLPILVEGHYINPIIDSLSYSRRNRGLRIHAFVIMPNHLHLVASVDGDLHAVVRDFKRFTSRTIHDLLENDKRRTLLEWLRDATEPSRRARGELGLWQPGFHPKMIYTPDVLDQKMAYLHDNLVRKGLVASPQDGWCSSARELAGFVDVCMPIDPIDL